MRIEVIWYLHNIQLFRSSFTVKIFDKFVRISNGVCEVRLERFRIVVEVVFEEEVAIVGSHTM